MRELDGHQVFGFFSAGARRLHARRAYLDRINVFPVPDGDTGANMAQTLAFAVDSAQVSESAALTLESLAETALQGARGNSGAIFAQFLVGLAECLSETARLDMERFAWAVGQAYASARKAVKEPREGTMLTVIHAWAEALRHEHSNSANFSELLLAAHPVLEASLAATQFQLAVLREAGVVDAGASGFVAFVEGGREYLEAGAPRFCPALADCLEVPAPVEEDHRWPLGADPRAGRRYCSEFFIHPLERQLDPEVMGEQLAHLGDSVIVAGGSRGARLHLHCDEPARVRDLVSTWGKIREQKVDDMHRQWEAASLPHGPVALVTDSTCDLPQELLDRHHIHVIPLTLRFAEEEFLDRLTLNPLSVYDRLDASPVFPTSSQPSPIAFERLYQGLLAHYERVIALHVSGRLSGTFEASLRAAEKVAPGRIQVLDTRHLSGSLGLIVLRAARLLEAGVAGEEVFSSLPTLCGGANILVSVRTLASMVRGGRVSPLKGFLATTLNLKPIVSVDATGASQLYGKALSVKRNVRKILGMAAKQHALAPVRSWAVVHGGNEVGARDLADRVEALLGFPPEHISPISAVIGLNAGRGSVALATLSY